MDLSTFLNIVSYVRDYKAFVRDELAHLLNQLGDIHYEVGLSFLRQSQHSYDRDGELRSAITAFALAHEQFCRAYDNPSLLDRLRLMAPGRGQVDRIGVSRKAFESACILAVMYTAIDDYPIAWDWLNRAMQAYFRYHDACYEADSGIRGLIARASGEGIEYQNRLTREYMGFKQVSKAMYRQFGLYGVLRKAKEGKKPGAASSFSQLLGGSEGDDD